MALPTNFKLIKQLNNLNTSPSIIKLIGEAQKILCLQMLAPINADVTTCMQSSLNVDLHPTAFAMLHGS